MELWQNIKFKPSTKYLEIYSSVSGKISIDYIPENLYYAIVEPSLNNRIYAAAYSDKNFYERFLPDYADIFPKTVLRGINSVHYNESYKTIQLNKSELIRILDPKKDYIIKPAVETSGGNNFHLFEAPKDTNNLNSFYEYVFKKILSFNYNFVFQERIIPSKWFGYFNSTSLNTIRLFTYRSVRTNDSIVSNSVLRFGKPGSLVDNQAAGGLTCGISDDGVLGLFAIDKMGQKYFDLKPIIEHGGKIIPKYQQMKDLVRNIAVHFPYHRLLGFDVTVDEFDKIKVLEINCKNIEINFLQMNNGPLFAEYNREIIEYSRTHKPIFTLNIKV